MASVLCTGTDLGLVQARSMVLENAGHVVTLATGEHDLLAIPSGTIFDIAVIGQVIATGQKQRIMSLIRERFPSAKVLELVQPFVGRILPNADDWLECSFTPPADLVERVGRLAAN